VAKSRGRGVLDAPLEPVIGLAEGETRWPGMTTYRRIVCHDRNAMSAIRPPSP
jgi:hypothetical protein